MTLLQCATMSQSSQKTMKTGKFLNSKQVFEEYVHNLTLFYRTDNIFIMCGEDFAYRNMTLNVAVLDIMTYLVENVSKYTVTISTPSDYFAEIFKSEETFPVFKGDFLPYITYDAEYMYSWTGFYTTRPYLKSRITQTEKLVRAAEILQGLVNNKAFAGYGNDVSTHHDAFTGTCRHETFVDYIRRLDQDYVKCIDAIGESFFTLPSPAVPSTALIVPCKVMILFNPINQNVFRQVSFTSNQRFVDIKDSEGTHIHSQSVPFNQSYEIFFTPHIESLGFKVLFIQEVANDYCIPSIISNRPKIHNGKIGVGFNEGLVSQIFNENEMHEVNTRLMGYNTSQAGAYILFPNVKII